ncbi:DUF2336 domain-containing protein [Shinella sp. CPCC 101442]|uniref:DUF2336 domain-containing protein n=1 Tax=Shinella sp. CPCC 101442 TaxID=2932265 RepID=UPI0021536E4C|nr:DUF2336 domain-containing protein [Shinella sp. CPCC 101442]MCR6501837.1 DUF2336 domain-containing protein [Shinella sp. CPCC 101442]
MIVHAFLRWVETARAADRAKAASVLAKAYAKLRIAPDDRRAAEMAMIFLLDDPAPKVRLALAEALAECEDVPRAVILPLAEDQPEIAAHIILSSSLLTDADLVDLAAKGSAVTRMLIANRAYISRAVSAAMAEIGDVPDVLALLENEGAVLSRRSLTRIADRLGEDAEIRALLLDRDDLPSDARHTLVEKVGTALAGFGLIQAAIGENRVERVTREACDVATIGMVGEVNAAEMPDMVEHLRLTGRLTPVFLMHALCTGRVEFFATAIANLSGQAERRVRSILSDGREAAVRALYETAGLGRDISALFAEATMLWRREAKGGQSDLSVSELLLSQARSAGNSACQSMLELVERLAIAEQRQTARSYALIASREAA